jgi:hypothetical protein
LQVLHVLRLRAMLTEPDRNDAYRYRRLNEHHPWYAAVFDGLAVELSVARNFQLMQLGVYSSTAAGYPDDVALGSSCNSSSDLQDQLRLSAQPSQSAIQRPRFCARHCALLDDD